MLFHCRWGDVGHWGCTNLTANMDNVGVDGASYKGIAVSVAEGTMRSINSGRHGEVEGSQGRGGMERRRWRESEEEVRK